MRRAVSGELTRLATRCTRMRWLSECSAAACRTSRHDPQRQFTIFRDMIDHFLAHISTTQVKNQDVAGVHNQRKHMRNCDKSIEIRWKSGKMSKITSVFYSVMGQNPGIDTKLRYFSEKKFRAFEFFHCARGVLRLVSGVRKDP